VRAAFRVLLAAALAASLAACGGGSNAVPASAAGELVLGPRDLGSAFTRFYDGRQSRLDVAGTSRSNLQRFDREGGWIARYHRGGSGPGPLVVESRVDVFKTSRGASSDLDAYRYDLRTIPAAQVRRIHVSGLGDASVAVTFVRPGALALRTYTIAWRDGNVSASVTAQGFDGRFAQADAVRLARLQERLISRA
jgi:hypothetical protein